MRASGFAIPINDVQEILSDLMKHGYVTGKPYLGITVSTVSSVTAQQYSNMVVGAYVNSVEEGSCAEKAGLQTGDIVTQVDGQGHHHQRRADRRQEHPQGRRGDDPHRLPGQ